MHDTLSYYTSRLDHDSEHTVNLFWGQTRHFLIEKGLITCINAISKKMYKSY